MREFQRQKKQRGRLTHWLFSPLAVVVLAVACVFLGRAVWNLYGKANETAIKVAGEQEQANELAGSDAALSSEVAHLQTPEGVDETIRSTYNVAKPGEDLIVIVASGTATTSP